MGLFLDEIPTTKRPPVSGLAVLSLCVAATGFLNAVGFVIGPVLAHIALARLRRSKAQGRNVRGRYLAIAALWLAYGALAAALVSLIVILFLAYAALPEPDYF